MEVIVVILIRIQDETDIRRTANETAQDSFLIVRDAVRDYNFLGIWIPTGKEVGRNSLLILVTSRNIRRTGHRIIANRWVKGEANKGSVDIVGDINVRLKNKARGVDNI